MKKQFTLVFLLLISLQTMSQLPKVTTGTLVRIAGFQSKYIDARNIDIWLPEGFDKTKKYPVLYMHDGQALYDAATTWNHQSWDVDDVAGKLISEKKIREVIVVGIWNGGKSRHSDYLPQKPYENRSVRNFLPHCAPKEPPSSTALRSGPTTISDSSYLN